MLHCLEPVAICNQFIFLLYGQLESEGWRKTFDIAVGLLIKTLCFDPVQLSQVSINNDLYATNGKYLVFR